MKRGEIWTVAGAKDYAGKLRPVVIIQNDLFDATKSITVCSFTTNLIEAPLFRLAIEPSEINGLRYPSRLMVDKINSVPRTKIGTHIGRLGDEDLVRLNRAIVVFLGIAGPASG